MSVPPRRLLAAFLVALAGAGPSGLRAQPQPAVVPPNTSVNPNIYVNPYQTLGQYAGNTAVLGRPLQNVPPGLGGYPAANYGQGYATPGGYSALLANTGAGGYGGSSSSGGYGMGYGYGTQWMQNPYEGYLSGAAKITIANAQYQLTIQQAKLLRQEAVRSAMDTRRRIIEEAEYERAHLPDPEKIRQADLARELDRARADPPLTEIWSARALNTLLRHLVKQQGRGERGPAVPLSEDTLRWINITPADSRANAGLLKDKGNLQWPPALMDARFKGAREDLARRIKEAVQQATVNPDVDAATLKDLGAGMRSLNDTLEANVSNLSPSQYIEARRYLNMVGDAVKALESRNASNYFNQNWAARGKTVADLVKFMGDQGLQFAPATPGDEHAYRALYHAMAAFDASVPGVARSQGEDR